MWLAQMTLLAYASALGFDAFASLSPAEHGVIEICFVGGGIVIVLIWARGFCQNSRTPFWWLSAHTDTGDTMVSLGVPWSE
jgi:hypothetical protein